MSSGKNPKITFQHFVIQEDWQNTRLLFLSLALYSGCDGYLWPKQSTYESEYSHWLLYAARHSDRWRPYELIGCWNKWRALQLKHTGCGCSANSCGVEPVSIRHPYNPIWLSTPPAAVARSALQRLFQRLSYFFHEPRATLSSWTEQIRADHTRREVTQRKGTENPANFQNKTNAKTKHPF